MLYKNRYYAATAYSPSNVPLSYLKHRLWYLEHHGKDLYHSELFPFFGRICLDGFEAREEIPSALLSRPSPEDLRKLESKSNPLREAGIADRMNHERIRFEHLAWPIRIIEGMALIGKVSLVLFTPLFTILYFYRGTDRYTDSFTDYLGNSYGYLIFIIFAPLFCWLFSVSVIKIFSRYLLKPGRGPEWELNRRTGMVKVWYYPLKIPFLKREEPLIEELPFYKFGGYLGGTTALDLNYHHRKISIPIGRDLSLYHKGLEENLVILKFFQNYMDTSKPLPDIPILEEFRHLDPVTAEHDRQAKRPSRYWRDMDNETFKKTVSAM